MQNAWVEVVNHTYAAEGKDVKELGMFALSLLSLPFGNASAERAFWQMNLIES